MEVRLDNITFSYARHPVLQSVSCTFVPEAFHVILGPNGSGKTTLLDIISGFTLAQSGLAYIGSRPVAKYSKRHLAKLIALVSQSYDIQFPFTVNEVVMMGRHPYIGRFSQPGAKDLSLADHAMEITGIRHLKHCLVTELSGGEKQRVVIARALCQDTPVLLLDEAFSNLDINHTLQMMRLLKDSTCNAGKTIISVLHDLNLAASWADILLFIKDGRVITQGETRSVFTEPFIHQVFDVQVNVEFNAFTQSSQAVFKV